MLSRTLRKRETFGRALALGQETRAQQRCEVAVDVAETTVADRAFLLRGTRIRRGAAFPFPPCKRGARGGGAARVGEDSRNAD